MSKERGHLLGQSAFDAVAGAPGDIDSKSLAFAKQSWRQALVVERNPGRDTVFNK